MAKMDLVRFDWAAKRLLRDKSNFIVLEGFLSTLLGENIRIQKMLESEGNQKTCDDKFNRVDMLAEDSKGQLIIIEVQNNRELDYFHRMLYGTSKAVTDYIHQGDPYSTVKKVYSVNIVYFDLGQGEDYVYRGKTEFRGIHSNDTLRLSVKQREQFVRHDAGDLFPEYYVLRVDEFDKLATTPLDEWIAFLKTGEIPETATAHGLPEARERLRYDKLNQEEKAEYDDHMEALRYQRSVIQTGIIEGYDQGRKEGEEKGLKKGRKEGMEKGMEVGRQKEKEEMVKKLLDEGLSLELVAKCTGLSIEEVRKAKR